MLIIQTTLYNKLNAQGVITTTSSFLNNNGTGLVTFNFQNTTTSPIAITDIAGVTGTSGSVAVELWYNTTPVNGAPGVISTANGWIQEAVGTITGIANTTTTTTQPFFTGLNFVIPANTTYGIAVYAAGQRYFTMTAAQTFSDLGCDLITGPNVSYGGGAPNGAAPINTPRGWIGTINFVFLAQCSGAPTAGTATAPTTVCANDSFNLSLSGQTVGSGLAYQWMSGPTATGPWTYIPGATTLSHAISQTVDTYYSCEVTCTNSLLADTSASVFVQTTPNLPAGTYTIGASGNYPNFNAAVAAMSCGIAGPVVFNVLPGSGPYNEQVEIPQIINASATNTITFNGNGETLTFSTTSSANAHIIRLNGADYVTINDLKIVTISVTNNFAIQLINDADFNTINNCRIDLSSTLGSTSTLNAGIAVSGSLTSATGLGASGNNNTFSNDTIIGGYYGITIVGASATARATANVLSNSVIQDFYLYGVYHSQANNTTVINNSLSRPIRSTLSSFYGIYYTTGGENNLAESNRLFDAFNGNLTSTNLAYPIYHTGVDATVGNENKVINNLIYNINHNGTIYGIYNAGSDGVLYYHNTISLDNTAATAGITRGFYQTTLASNIDFRNNIITISRGGTGNKHCIYLGTTTTTLTSNNNVFLMTATAGTNGIGWYSTNQATLTDWQLVNGGIYDANSVDADPLYANAPGGNFSPTSPAAGDFGAALGVLTDINGVARSATTPDPGAIEFVPPSCPQPSALNISAFTGFTADLAWTENGTATLWDIEWGTAGFTPTGTPNVLGTTTNPHQIGGLTPLTNYEFYVRADCGGPTSLWSGPFAFTTGCATQLAGTFTIGATGNYPTFTAAIADLNCGISAPVVFNVLPGSGPYNEQIEITPVIGASSVNTITFNGNGETLTFSTTASPNNYIIRLNGADHIIFDNLNVVSIAAANNFAIHLTNNADSNTIKNCTVNLTSAITSTSTLNAGIVVSGSLTSATVTGNTGTGNTILNNTIVGGYYGITNIGQALTTPSTNNTIDSNFVQDVYSYGIYLSNTSQTSITGNRINRPTRTNTTTFYGIYHTGGGERNVYEGNRIFDIYRSITNNTSTSYGIYHTGVDAGVGLENRVVNNMIYNINNNGALYGFYNSSSDGVFYYHNTVSLDDATSTATGVTRGFYQITTATGIEFKNNIVTINRGGTGVKHAIYLGSTLSTITSNNNTLFLANPTGTNGYGFYGSNFQTFANWQTANSNAYDQNSVDADPIFVGPTFGNLTPSNPTAGDFGDATLGVLTDINGVVRSATTPDPGAIEFVPPSCPQPSALGVNQQTTTASLLWTENGTATTWQIEWDTLGFFQGTGNLSLTTNNPSLITGLAPQGMYTFYVRSVCTPGDSSLWAGPFTFTTLCAPFTAPWLDNVESFLPTTNSTLSDACWSSSPSAITTQFRWDVDAFGSTPSLNTGPAGAFSGTNYFYTEANSGVTGDQAILTLPLIDASGLTVPMLEYYTHMFGTNMGNLFVEVFDGISWVKVDSLIGQQQTAETAPWIKQQVILTGFPDTLQIRFVGVKGNGVLGDMSLDDISVKEAPTCPEPKFLNVSNVLTNQASFGWTEMGSATSWQVEWGLSGFAQGNGVRILTNNNPHVQFGLTPGVIYDFYVRSICAPGDSSLWVGPFTFSTPICNPAQQCAYIFRMTDDFGDGWNGNTMDITQNGILVATIGSTFTAGAGPLDVSVNLCTNVPYALFWNTGGSFANEVGVEVIDPNLVTVFTKLPGVGTQGSLLYTDTASCPTCPTPTNVTATPLTTTSVDVSWTSFLATTWQVEWDTLGFAQGTGNISITSNNPFNLTGLTAGGIYDFYVRGICAPGDTSNWSHVTITMPFCNPNQQCLMTFRMTDSFGDGWNGNTMDVTQNGVLVATIGSTFIAGAGPVDVTVPLCDGVPFELFWNTGGSFANEVGVEVINSSNVTLFTKLPGAGVQGTILFVDTVDCPCAAPTNLTATNITTTSVDLTWTENGSATTWNIEYDTTGFTLGTGVTASTVNNPETVTGLLPGTTYEYYVQSDCGQDSSAWVGPFSFTTPSICNPILGGDTIVCSTDTLVLDAGAGFSSYLWSTGATTQTVSLDTTSLGGNGIYTITVDVEDSLIGCVGSDTIVVTFSTCVGVKENKDNIAMNVYPNPSNGEFTVNLTLKNTTNLQIRITNIQGQEVFVKNNFANLNVINEQINIGNVKGIYFVNVITNNEVITKKIIVQ